MDSSVQIPSLTRIKKGLRIFVALTVVGLAVVMYRSSIADSVAHLKAFDWRYLLLGCGLILLDLGAAGSRIYVFASKVYPPIPFFGCVRASLANTFLGGVTPSQTGGGAGQIYVLYKEGMTAFDATLVSFVGSFLLTAIFLPVCGLLTTIFARPAAVDVRLEYIVITSMAVFGLILVLAVSAMISPRRFQSMVDSCLRRTPRFKRWLEKKGALAVWFDLLVRYRDMVMFFLTRGKRVFAAGFLLTVLVYFNKFVMAFVVLKGLGISAGFWEVIYAQLVLMLIYYFSPSPGASGIAEVSAAIVMGGIIPAGYGGAFVLLWRLFTLYINLTIGAAVLLRYIYKRRVVTDDQPPTPI